MNDFVVAAEAVNGTLPRVNWNIYSWVVDKFSLGGTNTAVILTLVGVLLCIIIPYLLGSINPAIIFSKLVYNDDIRDHGSGNAGTTNTLRTYGWKMAVLILVIDFMKASLAVIIGSLIITKGIGGAVAAVFVILGHMFPIYYRFKGGKGVASMAGAILVLSPVSFVVLVVLFVAIVFMSRFVSLASIMCAMLYPILHNAFYPGTPWITIANIFMMLLVIFMHRENIKRIMAGKESKISFGKKKKDKPDGDENDNA